MVVMAAASAIVRRSPHILRASFTLVGDQAPGLDAERVFKERFTAAGGPVPLGVVGVAGTYRVPEAGAFVTCTAMVVPLLPAAVIVEQAAVIVEQQARRILPITGRAAIPERGRPVHQDASEALLRAPAIPGTHLGVAGRDTA